MSRAGIQMFAPKPFFSVIGKYVVQLEMARILGAAAWASAVVSDGAVVVRTAVTDDVGPPAARVSSTWLTLATVCFMSRARPVFDGTTPTTFVPEIRKDALRAERATALATGASARWILVPLRTGRRPPSDVGLNE